jgi:glutaredoxin 3|tara:strand:+ start:461 stop:706 length:246 start_codon:yes stop_codon:yes gene_type:complete
MHRFTVYSKDGCGHCTKIQQLLLTTELKHVIYKLDDDFTRDEFINQFGKGSYFPQIVLNDKVTIGGAQEFVKYLTENKLVP